MSESKELESLRARLQALQEKTQQLEDVESDSERYQKNIALVEESKQQLHHIVESYFKELQTIFIFLRRYYPSKEIQTLMLQQIEQTFQELSRYRKKIVDKTFSKSDLDEFHQTNYMQKQREFEIEASALQSKTFQNHTATNMPAVRIQNRLTECLPIGLNQYAFVYWAGEKDKKIVVNRHNYFTGQTICCPYLEDDFVAVYDVPTSKTFRSQLPEKLPQDCSYLCLPDGTVFLSGGVDPQGFILGTTLYIDVTKPEILRKTNMLTKRIAHSLVWVPPLNVQATANKGYIYVIGGKVQHNVRTRLCERFDLQTEKWEPIEKLNQARSRAACAYMPEQHYILVFFGTGNTNTNVIQCETYNLLSGQWSNLQIINYLQGFDFSWGFAMSINEDQVLLFGGLRDSHFNQPSAYFSRKLMIYNLSNSSMTVQESQLPIDFLPLNAQIHDNCIYSVGKYMSCVHPASQMAMGDGAFVLQVGQVNSICSFIQ